MLGLALLCADSVGEVRLRSRDPRDLPLIFPNLLTEQRDVERLVEASRMAEALAHDAAFSELNGGRIDAKPKTRAEWRDWVRGTAVNSAHPVGTCRMGEDALAVVDYGLKVRGLAGLRVADASIFPATPRGNTNAPAIMVGERVADFVCAGG